MKNSEEKICKIIDLLKLAFALISLVVILVAIKFKSTGVDYSSYVNVIVSYLLSGFVFLTGIKTLIKKTNNYLGFFLILCAIIILILNVIANRI